MTAQQHHAQLLRTPAWVTLSQRHDRLDDVLGSRLRVTVRRTRSLLQRSRTLGFEPLEPFVASLPTDPEVLAQIAETVLTSQVCCHELHSLGHLVGPRPRHRTILLGRAWCTAGCYPCTRSAL